MIIELEITKSDVVEGVEVVGFNTSHFKIILNPPVYITKSLGRELLSIFNDDKEEKVIDEMDVMTEISSNRNVGREEEEGGNLVQIDGTSLESLLVSFTFLFSTIRSSY